MAKSRSKFNLCNKEDKIYPSVKKVTPARDFTLSVIFSNGESGILDMKPVLNFGIFNKLQDIDEFNRVKVAYDTIEWECGADLDPEFIYAKCRKDTSM